MGAPLAVATRFRLDEVLKAREKAGNPISQSQLSRQANLSLTTVNAIALNKTKQVSLATLDALCDVLGVEPGELLEREKKRGRKG